MDRKPPPEKLTVETPNGDNVVFQFLEGGFVVRRGYWCYHLSEGDALRLTRWLLWHALWGRWKPRE